MYDRKKLLEYIKEYGGETIILDIEDARGKVTSREMTLKKALFIMQTAANDPSDDRKFRVFDPVAKEYLN